MEQPRESSRSEEAGVVFSPDEDEENDAEDGSQPGAFGEVQSTAQAVAIDPGPSASAGMDEDDPEAWQDDSLPPPPPLDFPAWEWAPPELVASPALPILPAAEAVHFPSPVVSANLPLASSLETPVPPRPLASPREDQDTRKAPAPAEGGEVPRPSQAERWVREEGGPSPARFAPSGVGLLESPEPDARPQMAVITLRSSGNKPRDVLRLKRIHGTLVSNPGQDHFAFQIFENNRSYKLDFPNETTRLTPNLIAYLVDQAGEGNLQIQ